MNPRWKLLLYCMATTKKESRAEDEIYHSTLRLPLLVEGDHKPHIRSTTLKISLEKMMVLNCIHRHTVIYVYWKKTFIWLSIRFYSNQPTIFKRFQKTGMLWYQVPGCTLTSLQTIWLKTSVWTWLTPAWRGWTERGAWTVQIESGAAGRWRQTGTHPIPDSKYTHTPTKLHV